MASITSSGCDTQGLLHTHTGYMCRGGRSSSSSNTNRNRAGPDYRSIDPVSLTRYKESHQVTKAQSATTHRQQTLDIQSHWC